MIPEQYGETNTSHNLSGRGESWILVHSDPVEGWSTLVTKLETEAWVNEHGQRWTAQYYAHLRGILYLHQWHEGGLGWLLLVRIGQGGLRPMTKKSGVLNRHLSSLLSRDSRWPRSPPSRFSKFTLCILYQSHQNVTLFMWRTPLARTGQIKTVLTGPESWKYNTVIK